MGLLIAIPLVLATAAYFDGFANLALQVRDIPDTIAKGAITFGSVHLYTIGVGPETGR